MKRSEVLATAPESFNNFVKNNPAETRWDVFRNNDRAAYQDLRAALRNRQRGLCAFCEIYLREGDQQVEHWIPKSSSTIIQNWTFDIGNFHLSCENVNKRHWFTTDKVRGAFPDPGPNEHCGQAKGNQSPNTPIDGALPIRPTDIPLQTSLFSVQTDGVIYPSNVGCQNAGIDSMRAAAAITLLNLNCTRLRQMREVILDSLDKVYRSAVENGATDVEALEALCDVTIVLDEDGGLPEFLTAIRSYFGDIADERLRTIPDWAARP